MNAVVKKNLISTVHAIACCALVGHFLKTQTTLNWLMFCLNSMVYFTIDLRNHSVGSLLWVHHLLSCCLFLFGIIHAPSRIGIAIGTRIAEMSNFSLYATQILSTYQVRHRAILAAEIAWYGYFRVVKGTDLVIRRNLFPDVEIYVTVIAFYAGGLCWTYKLMKKL